MQRGESPEIFKGHTVKRDYKHPAIQPDIRRSRTFAFGINTTFPPLTDPQMIMQCADQVTTLQRMLGDTQTSAVFITGNPGAGKSTLAALLFRRLQLALQANLPAPRYLVWLGIGTYTTLPDIIAAILNGVNIREPGFLLLKPNQQIAALIRALRRPADNALIVLDQFESMLHPETNQGVAGRGTLPLFLKMLQSDLGASRILLTSYYSPFDENREGIRVRSYLATRISIPEGTALLQLRGVQGSPEELSLVWQRCAGSAFALVLFSAVVKLSGISLSYLLTSPDYQPFWAGEVTSHLIAAVYHYLNPPQSALMRALGLFLEPVSLEGIVMTAMGSGLSGNESKGLSATDFKRELDILTQLSLIQVSLNPDKTPCYSLHPLLRQYAQEHYLEGSNFRESEALAPSSITVPLDPTPNSSEALPTALAHGHVQAAAYYQYAAHKYSPPREQRQGLQDVVSIISAIRHLCLGSHWQRACDFLFEEGLHESMVQWGAWNTLIGLYIALLPPFGILVRRDEGLIYSHVGTLYGRLGEYQQCLAYFERALTIQRQIGDQQGEISTLTNQGELLRVRGENDLARAHFKRALSLNKELQDPRMQCVLLHNLGLLHHSKLEYQQASHYYNESLRLAYGQKELQGQRHTGMILTNLGMLFYEQGFLQEALAILLAALRLRQTLLDPTVDVLELFLTNLEQKMGSPVYTRLYQEALAVQQQVITSLVAKETPSEIETVEAVDYPNKTQSPGEQRWLL